MKELQAIVQQKYLNWYSIIYHWMYSDYLRNQEDELAGLNTFELFLTEIDK